MKIRTNERNVNLSWVIEETSLILLDEHPDDEICEIINAKTDQTLFVCTFRALKQLRDIKHSSSRINNNYEQRRNMVAANLAAGGNPG